MTDSNKLILGIDGGGTSTEAWLARGSDEVIGRGRAGASNAKAVGASASREALTQAIAAAFADAGLPIAPAASACLGLAGFDHPDERAELRRWADEGRWAEKIVLVNDGDLVVAAGTPEGWGIGVIAGTGSIAVGRSREGKTARAGGWGHLFGDEGSAYYVVLGAFRRLARRMDGRDAWAPGTDPLAERLCASLGVSSPEQFVSALYAPDCDRTRIASLAPAVTSASKLDPTITVDFLEPAGEALAEQAAAVAKRLGFENGDLPLAMAGGFLLSCPSVSDALLDGLTRRGYRVTAKAVVDPVEGALVLANNVLFSQ